MTLRVPGHWLLMAALWAGVAVTHAQAQAPAAGTGPAAVASPAAQSQEPAPAAAPPTVFCSSTAGERHHCAANTAAGVALLRSTGTGACLLGKTWGYDDAGVWVSDGCSGEFALGQAAREGPVAPEPAPPGEAAQPAAPKQSFYPVPKKLEAYGATSQTFGDDDAGFDRSDEYLGGVNVYPANTRNHRLNVQVIRVNRSPVSSTFGYYVGGQKGTIVSTAFSVFV